MRDLRVGDRLIFNAELEHGNQQHLNMFRSWKKALAGTIWTASECGDNHLIAIPDDNRVDFECLSASAFPVFKLVGGINHGE
ncbi:hypothetical protein [Ochrobactrum chromiisoli]|uniref:Uncharacterized protein n=1 Tax=Ochrobactrum chromiisoli TaxID=2993941 RepID=A0ABT3QM53_9HYPH|nr:hypothetical protein [Ochrobactrum chromiisoli]MCX2696670.1 hypothetical protein [Ochrobactrum chromiisoli]